MIVPVVAVALLAGCAPQPIETPPPTTPTVEPTPTPTPEPVALEPLPTLPLGCADLAALSDVQDRIPGGPIEVSVDETSVPTGWYWAGFATAGGLRCVWGGTDRTDGGYSQGFQIAVLADADTDYDRWVSGDTVPVVWDDDLYGDRSHTYCAKDYQNGCYGGLTVDGFWVDFSLRDYEARTKAVAKQRLGELLEPIVAAIRSAGDARPAWTPPAGVYDGVELCADGSVPSDVVGKKTTVTPFDYGDDHTTIEFAGAARADLVNCTWTSSAAGLQNIDVTVFPGGAWIYPRMLADPAEATPWYLSDGKPADIPGADGTMTAHADAAWAAMSIGGSLIMVSDGSTYEVSDLVPALKRLAAHISQG